jgi:hypothetical protein
MIARLMLRMGQRQVVATLDDDLAWHCQDDLLIHSFLNAVYGAESAPRTGPTPVGHFQARRAAVAVESVGWTCDLRFAEAGQDAA